MGETYRSDFNLKHEEVYEELERVKTENYHLRRKISSKHNTVKAQSKLIEKLERKIRESKESKQHYRNGRKRGANGFNG